MKLLPIALSPLALLPLALRAPQDPAEAVTEVQRVLNDLHAAAAEADADRYFDHLAPDAVFFGTDPGERWEREEYEQLLRPVFEQGVKIVNEPTVQNVFVSADGTMAWFDEQLDKPKYGEMRATGVLRRTDDGWQVVQFHLTFPIPNEIFQDVVKLARAAKKSH